MIDYKLDNEIAYIQMDDGKANVFSIPMSHKFSELLTQAENEAKATVILGREGQFSAGYCSIRDCQDPIVDCAPVPPGQATPSCGRVELKSTGELVSVCILPCATNICPDGFECMDLGFTQICA